MNDLLTLDDIAAMWRCSRRHARDIVVKGAGFPETAPGSTVKNPVWLKVEVKAFAHRRPKIPAQFPQHAPQPA